MTDSTIDNMPKYYLTPARIFILSITIVAMLVMAPMALFPVRNWNPRAVAVRYLKSSPAIKAEAGDIANVAPFEVPSRSQQIARRLQAGEYPFPPDPEKKDGEIPRVTRLPDGTTRERLKVTGAKREFEAEVYLERRYFGDANTAEYYVVAEVKFKNEGDQWINVPIGWTDNYFLLFK